MCPFHDVHLLQRDDGGFVGLAVNGIDPHDGLIERIDLVDSETVEPIVTAVAILILASIFDRDRLKSAGIDLPDLQTVGRRGVHAGTIQFLLVAPKFPLRLAQILAFIPDVFDRPVALGGVKLGRAFWKGGDKAMLDGVLIDGSASVVERSSRVFRRLQTGFLYHYAFAMIIGLILLLGGLWFWGLR